ncbi:protein PFF0380w-like [Drosophila sulfurigaster albostrigata]|uniref:protein PFF0380w-like n=1 Tax=Drosophila sulfurigaster albostrigata TaxID=89887 RepID=UPI002D21CBFA|nr:protein PFF0380w-like [Drosophila sulfurigaster albostrigata]
MEEYNKLVAQYDYQYQCKTNVDVSSSSASDSSDSESENNITSGLVELNKSIKGRSSKDSNNNADNVSGKRKRNSGTGTQRLPTRRPDPNVYNRNALLARENRRKKKAYMEAVEKELDETRSKNRWLLKALKKQLKITQKLKMECDYLKTSVTTHKPNKMSRCFISDIPTAYNHRSVSPDGSLISTNSNSSGNSNNNENQMDSEFIADILNVDNDYQPTPEYENENAANYLDQSFVGLGDLEAPLETPCFLNKVVSPIWEWSASCTPPSQLLQDDNFLDFDDTARIASL